MAASQQTSNRTLYNNALTNLNNTLSNPNNATPLSYQDALKQYTQNFGGQDSTISPQEIQATLYNMYNKIGYFTPGTGPLAQSQQGDPAQVTGGVATDPNGLTPADISGFNQSISNTQNAIGNLGTQQNAQSADINTSLSNALAQLLQGQQAANTSYTNNKNASTSNYVAGKNTIASNAGSTLNGLLRLLGSRGAGGGSAYNVTAPGDVAQQATLQRQDLGNTYGANQQALDSNYGTYMQGYNDNVANTQKNADQQQSDLAHQIALSKANLLQTLAGYQAQAGQGASSYQPNLDQANQLLAQQAGYRSVAPQQITANPYTAPSLASYTTNPNATPTVQGQAPGNDYTSPALSALLGKKQLATTAAG